MKLAYFIHRQSGWKLVLEAPYVNKCATSITDGNCSLKTSST